MTLPEEIRKVQAIMRIQKQFVHEPRDGKPVPGGVARTWQVLLTCSQSYLQELAKLSKEGKLIRFS
jgi:hypothetical protein